MRDGEGRGVKMLHTYIQTYRHTEPLTKWVVEELSLLKNIILYLKKPGFDWGRGFLRAVCVQVFSYKSVCQAAQLDNLLFHSKLEIWFSFITYV